MPVPTLVTDLSTTLASNSPSGSDNVFPDLDNYLRAMSGFIASIRDNSGNGWVSPYLPLTYSAGSANGVVYLNGSKVVTTGSGLVFDGTNLGIGTISPSTKLHVSSGATDEVARFEGTGSPFISLYDTNVRQFYLAAGSTQVELVVDVSKALLFGTNGAEKMRLDSSGNLGIGASSPQSRLHSLAASNGDISLRLSSGTGDTANGQYTTEIRATSSTGTYFQNLKLQANNFQWFSTGSEIMRLDSSGNLGLGVTPSAWGSGKAIQVSARGALFGFSDDVNTGLNAYYDGTNFKYIETGFASRAVQTAGQHRWFTASSGTAGNTISFTQAMTLTSDGKLGIGTSAPSYRLDIVGPANTPHISSYDGNVQSVAAYPDGSGASARNYTGTLSNHDNVFLTNNVERGRFTAGGDFLVGTATLAGAGGISLQSQGGTGFAVINNNNAGATGYVFESFRRSGTEIGSITQNGTTGVLFNISSDRRLKDNIAPAPSASDAIDAIEIVSYDWKAAPDEHVTYGVIAQDLALVAPHAVRQGDDGEEIEKTWGVDYSKLVPMLIKEIQSLRARVAALEAA